MRIHLTLLFFMLLLNLEAQNFRHQATIGYYVESLTLPDGDGDLFGPDGVYDHFNEMMMLRYFHLFGRRFSGRLDVGLDIGLLPNFIELAGGYHPNEVLMFRGSVRKMIIPHDYTYFESQVQSIYGPGFYGYNVDNTGVYMDAYRSIYQLGVGMEARIGLKGLEVYAGSDFYGGLSSEETYIEQLEALNSNLLILHETTMDHPYHFSLQGNAGLFIPLIKTRYFWLGANFETRIRGDWFKFISTTDRYEWTSSNHQQFKESSRTRLYSIQNQFGAQVYF